MDKISTGLYMGGLESEDEYDQDGTIMDGGDEGSDAGSDADEDREYYNPQTKERSRKRVRSATPVGETSTKRARVEGTSKHATAVKAKADREDDERIWELKKQGYTKVAIANKLREEKRCNVQPATIDSRYKKIREKKEKQEDERLDDELSDWHVGEDENLRESFSAIEKKIELRIQQLQEQKWKQISDHLATTRHNNIKKYTGKACKERFEGLLDGTALKPIELDPNQEDRATMRKDRIAEAKQARRDAAEAAAQAEAQKQWEAGEHMRHRGEKRKAREEQKQAKLDFDAEMKRIREEKAAGKAAEREAKEIAAERARKELQDRRETKLAEESIYRYYTGKALNRTNDRDRKKKNDDSEDEDEGYEDWEDSEDESVGDEVDDLEDEMESAASLQDDEAPTRHTIEEKRSKVSTRRTTITKETLLNPRSIMTDAELEVKLFERGLPRRKVTETHPQLVARLAAADQSLSATELNNLLKNHFLNIKGNSQTKIRRLQEYEAEHSAAGQNGTKSTDLDFKTKYEGYSGQWTGLIDDE